MSTSKEKKVIFIGGTSFSGSTLLDMLLANSPSGFSCGEVYALFHPFRKHHLDYKCGCGDPHCGIWPEIERHGVRHLYQTIFEMLPEVDCIVDSSKDPMWIRDRTADLKDSDITANNVLIWKTPEEFYQSRLKRKQEQGWEREWIHYHRHYFAMADNWVSLPYADLAKSPDTLERLCDRLQISYFAGKKAYWEKKHHTLFGNTSARIHLYDRKSDQFQQCRQELSSQDTGSGEDSGKSRTPYQEIYYSSPDTLAQQDQLTVPPITNEIEDVLVNTSLFSDQQSAHKTRQQIEHLKAGYIYRIYRRLRRAAIFIRRITIGV